MTTKTPSFYKVSEFREDFSIILGDCEIQGKTNTADLEEAIRKGFAHIDEIKTFKVGDVSEDMMNAFSDMVTTVVGKFLDYKEVIEENEFWNVLRNEFDLAIFVDPETGKAVISIRHKMKINQLHLRIYANLTTDVYYNDQALSNVIQGIKYQILHQLLRQFPQLKPDIEMNLYIKTEKFEGYEFSTIESIEVEPNLSYDCFRLEKHFADGQTYIKVASTDDYSVYDNVTHLFDVDFIEAECREQVGTGSVRDATEDYLKFLKEDEE